MNAFQKCSFTADAVPLYLPQQLYLKPIAQITITVHLPTKLVGKVVSNWELMEKLRSLILPDEFSVLKVSKNTIELIRLHAELEDKGKLNKVINKIDKKLIKLKEFQDLFKVRASEGRLEFPNRHIWDSFFREAKDMNEMKSGERPDTMHISNLPIRWFVPYHLSGEEDIKPSEKIFYRIFEKFGRIRHVDIPICDPYRMKMKSHISGLQTFTFDEKYFFEGYVQFKDYQGFSNAMDAFRAMKLLHKDHECNETYMVNINVDFDKTKHMSEASIRRREIVRERLIRKQKEKEEKEEIEKAEILKKQEVERQKELNLKKEKEKRRREREENRKAKILAQLKIKDADDINDKIAKEEKKLLKAQRKLEAIRLIEELFRRIKVKHETDPLLSKNSKANVELSKYKKSSEIEFQNRQTNLHHSIAGRVVLKTILSRKLKPRKDSSSSDTSLSLEEADNEEKNQIPETPKEYPLMYQYPPLQNSMYPYFAPVGPSAAAGGQHYFPYHHKRRGGFKGAGPSRGYRRGRGGYNPNYRNYNKNPPYYPPELQIEYYKYFQKFLRDQDGGDDNRNYSRSRSRSRSKYRRSRSRRRSYSRSRRSRTRSRSRKSYSRSRSRSKSRQRSRRSSSRRTRSPHRDRHRSRSRSVKSRSRSRSKTSKNKEKSRSRSNLSVDSSNFISPNRLRTKKSRSRSWSIPTTSNKNDKRSSWSRSPT